MSISSEARPGSFLFRSLPKGILIGTASDRYAGWIGKIYSEGKYEKGIAHRSHKVGDKTFNEETLPVESVTEYFEHFPLLEIDYSFYRLLLEANGNPTQNFHVLKSYRQHMKDWDVENREEISQLSISQDLKDLRDLARERESISHLISATKVEMKRVLRTTFPELESVGDLFTRSMLRFLKEYPSARRVKMAKLKNLAKVLNQPQVGNKLSFSVEDILRAAQSSVATAYKLIRVILAMLSHRTYFQAKMA